MKYTLFDKGKKIGDFTTIEPVDKEIERIAKSIQGYHRHNESLYILGSESRERVNYLIMTKVFDINGNIIEDLRNKLIIKK